MGSNDSVVHDFGNFPNRISKDIVQLDDVPGDARAKADGRNWITAAGPGSALNQPSSGPQVSKQDKAQVDYLMLRQARFLRSSQITAALPAHQSPGVYSNPINLSARFVLPAAVGDYVTAFSITYLAPKGRWARFVSYGFDVDGGFSYDGSILWQITKNGQPIPSLQNFAQHRGSLQQPCQTYFLCEEEVNIQFQVRRAVAAVGTNNVDMILNGYDWRLRGGYEGTQASVTAF